MDHHNNSILVYRALAGWLNWLAERNQRTFDHQLWRSGPTTALVCGMWKSTPQQGLLWCIKQQGLLCVLNKPPPECAQGKCIAHKLDQQPTTQPQIKQRL
jgi:hypothetical protein